MSEQLWPNERIEEAMWGVWDDDMSPDEIVAFAAQVRDDYEKRLADLSRQLEAMAERYRQIDEYYLSQAKQA